MPGGMVLRGGGLTTYPQEVGVLSFLTAICIVIHRNPQYIVVADDIPWGLSWVNRKRFCR